MTAQPGPSIPTALPSVPRRRCWLTGVLTLVVFGAGIAIGWSLSVLQADQHDRYYREHPEQMPTRIVERLDKELGLSSRQRRELLPIAQAWWQGWQQARRETYPAYKPSLEQADQRISAILTPQQKPKWDAYYQGMSRRFGSESASPASGPATRP